MEKFTKKVWLSSPTMHGDEMKYVKQAYDTNWMSTVGENINEVERIAAEKSEITAVSGDVNKDGTFSIADAVSLQNYLLGKSDAILADLKAADLYTDNKIDVYDFI
ncbi:MAG: hypothetical protein IJW79_04530, partial [Clostridia bacterium]|nr:hypothetical protein [Clostridia bacterium]